RREPEDLDEALVLRVLEHRVDDVLVQLHRLLDLARGLVPVDVERLQHELEQELEVEPGLGRRHRLRRGLRARPPAVFPGEPAASAIRLSASEPPETFWRSRAASSSSGSITLRSRRI